MQSEDPGTLPFCCNFVPWASRSCLGPPPCSIECQPTVVPRLVAHSGAARRATPTTTRRPIAFEGEHEQCFHQEHDSDADGAKSRAEALAVRRLDTNRAPAASQARRGGLMAPAYPSVPCKSYVQAGREGRVQAVPDGSYTAHEKSRPRAAAYTHSPQPWMEGWMDACMHVRMYVPRSVCAATEDYVHMYVCVGMHEGERIAGPDRLAGAPMMTRRRHGDP